MQALLGINYVATAKRVLAQLALSSVFNKDYLGFKFSLSQLSNHPKKTMPQYIAVVIRLWMRFHQIFPWFKFLLPQLSNKYESPRNTSGF